ncbi:hypothetical protein VNO77_27339 [Canavalia gladiata]|uniref:Uncharacterized protein n=1 Tax=Canavalia gladiata TaxID=3824 RepID=A0AAN9KYN9_CANGL
MTALGTDSYYMSLYCCSDPSSTLKNRASAGKIHERQEIIKNSISDPPKCFGAYDLKQIHYFLVNFLFHSGDSNSIGFTTIGTDQETNEA